MSSAATVACVVKVDHESLRVLDQNGTIRSILPSQVSNKIEPRKNAVATDRSGSEVRLGDTVKDLYGENQKGVILHIYRSFLFLHDREQLENAGIFVARSTNVMTIAAKGGRATANAGPDLSKMNPARAPNGMNGSGGMAPPKSMGRDRLLGQTVSIRKGPHKGLMGIVKDTTDTQARVELHTKAKIVTVDKEILGMKEYVVLLPFPRLQLTNSQSHHGSEHGHVSFRQSTQRRLPGKRQPRQLRRLNPCLWKPIRMGRKSHPRLCYSGSLASLGTK